MDWFNLNVDDTADDNDDGDREYNLYVSVSTTFISGETKKIKTNMELKTNTTIHIQKKCISYMSQYDPFWTPFGSHTKNIISKIILHKDISSNFNPKLVIPLDSDI